SAAPVTRLLSRFAGEDGAFPIGLWFPRQPRFRFPALRGDFRRCCCGSHLHSPFHRIALRLPCFLAHEPLSPTPLCFYVLTTPPPWPAFWAPVNRARYASSREPATEIDYFFTSSVNALDCSNPLSFSPTICCS